MGAFATMVTMTMMMRMTAGFTGIGKKTVHNTLREYPIFLMTSRKQAR